MRRAITLALLAAAAFPACDLIGGSDAPEEASPTFDERSPVPGQPPIVWVGGRLQQIDEDRVTIRDASDATIAMQRLSAGTTRFLSSEGDAWRELSEEEVGEVQAGRTACVEVLLDGSNFVALRIFLDATCGPFGGAP